MNLDRINSIEFLFGEGGVVRLQHKAFTILADYHQFYLWDREMTSEAPVDYTDEDVQRRIKVGPYVVVIQPERNTTVPVEVEVHDFDPGFDAAEWDHIAEASLDVPTGNLQVHECTGTVKADLRIDPDCYRVRSLHAGLGSIDEFGMKGNDRYLVVLWPATSEEVRVVKLWKP
jgi:hypothetical protein